MSKAQSKVGTSKAQRDQAKPDPEPSTQAADASLPVGQRLQNALAPLRTGGPARLILDGEHDRVPPEQRVSAIAKLAVSGYLIGTTLLCLMLLWLCWPYTPADTETSVEVIGDYERGLILISMLAGGLGACIHALQSIGAFLGERSMMRSWVPWYFLRPFLGMGLAFMAFVVLAGGLMQGNASALSPFGVAAISALAGLFSRRAIQKLAEVCDTIFQLKTEDERSGALTQDPQQEPNEQRPKSDPPREIAANSDTAARAQSEPIVRAGDPPPPAS